jgi:hypothetical protein
LHPNSKAEHYNPKKGDRVDFPVALDKADFGCGVSKPFWGEHFVQDVFYFMWFDILGIDANVEPPHKGIWRRIPQ